MWQVIEDAAESLRRDALLAEVSGRQTDREALRGLVTSARARGAVPPQTLLDELERDPEEWTSSLYSVDIWGSQAADGATCKWARTTS